MKSNINHDDLDVVRSRKRKLADEHDKITEQTSSKSSSVEIKSENRNVVNVISQSLEHGNVQFAQTIFEGFDQINQSLILFANETLVAFNQLQASTNQTLKQAIRLDILLNNSSAQYDEDTIVPPPHQGQNTSNDVLLLSKFPQTLGEIKLLKTGPTLQNIENYYDLPHTGNIMTRRRRVLRAYGIRSDIF